MSGQVKNGKESNYHCGNSETYTDVELPTETIMKMDFIQLRVKDDKATVRSYADDMKEGDELPSIHVFVDEGYESLAKGIMPGIIPGWVADGRHTTLAAVEAEVKNLKVRVHKGKYRDALRYALTALNESSKRGLRAKPEDNIKAVQELIKDDPNLTQAQIAALCGLSQSRISRICGKIKVDTSSPRGRPRGSKGKPAKDADTSSVGKKGGSSEGASGNYRSGNSEDKSKEKAIKPVQEALQQDQSANATSVPNEEKIPPIRETDQQELQRIAVRQMREITKPFETKDSAIIVSEFMDDLRFLDMVPAEKLCSLVDAIFQRLINDEIGKAECKECVDGYFNPVVRYDWEMESFNAAERLAMSQEEREEINNAKSEEDRKREIDRWKNKRTVRAKIERSSKKPVGSVP